MNQKFVCLFFLLIFFFYLKRKKFVNLSNLIFESSNKFINETNRPLEITTFEAFKYGLNNNENLTRPWSLSLDYNIRKFTFEKYFKHNNFQVIKFFNFLNDLLQFYKSFYYIN